MEEFNTSGERLWHLVTISGKTKSGFAAECDINPSNFIKMLKGELGITNKTAKKVEDALGYSAVWIMKGLGSQRVKGWVPASHKDRGVPYYDDLPVSAGQRELATVHVDDEIPAKYVSVPGLKEGQFAFPVIGCSMEPTIKAGEIVVVSEVNNWERVDPDKVYLVITEDDRMIKHLSSDVGNKDILWCISDNENFARFSIFKTEIKKIYRVTFHGSLL